MIPPMEDSLLRVGMTIATRFNDGFDDGCEVVSGEIDTANQPFFDKVRQKKALSLSIALFKQFTETLTHFVFLRAQHATLKPFYLGHRIV